jgi:5'-nucleotidase
LKRALEHAVADDRPAAHVSGVEVWYDPRKRVGGRITNTRLADGRGIDDKRVYTLAVSDFLATGGSGYTMLRELRAEDVGIVDLDALIQYLAALRQPVEAPEGARLHRLDR